ncbi:MAG: class I SAM-dependent methyltransferase, partial [Rhodospirillales bacterium]|nr:class I SAM-dependent methyltransferase [Rhodospirillales bacterium]
GCGDGNQISLIRHPLYLGLDVSRTAIDRCRDRFRYDPAKSFLWYDPARTINIANFLQADLTLSLDVLYHLVEDDVYRRYQNDLFGTSRRFVIIYSSDSEDRSTVPHVRHRRFTTDVERDFPDFRLIDRIGNRYPEQSFCSFFVYERIPR